MAQAYLTEKRNKGKFTSGPAVGAAAKVTSARPGGVKVNQDTGNGEAAPPNPLAPLLQLVPQETPSPVAEQQKAQHQVIDAHIQRYAEEYNEKELARRLGGVSLPDGEPVDVLVPKNPKDLPKWQSAIAEREAKFAEAKAQGKARPNLGKLKLDGDIAYAVELKTMVTNQTGQIRMKADAIDRKSEWEKNVGAKIYTVVMDDRNVFNAGGAGKHDESKRKVYVRAGYGNFNVANMHDAQSYPELNKILKTPQDKLEHYPRARR